MSATYPDGVLLRSGDETYLVVAGERQLIQDETLLNEINAAPREGSGAVPVLNVDAGELDSIPVGPEFEARGLIEASRQDEVHSDMPRRYMSSTVRLSQEAGRLDGDTRTWTTQPWIGFTGGVCVLLAGANGEILHCSDVVQFGVDGFRIPFKRSDRTDHWVQAVPADVAQRTTRIEILHTHAPKVRILQIIQEIGQTVNAVDEALRILRLL
ncbi:hypothetical protein [Solirubrobacter soli]|uniref:hypothetical protein n=1 Tax=Solirubrobacter soli TaxID=363832 RepID=UPI00040F8B40|nr:hypothetical protein [Solirubrobacter soli]